MPYRRTLTGPSLVSKVRVSPSATEITLPWPDEIQLAVPEPLSPEPEAQMAAEAFEPFSRVRRGAYSIPEDVHPAGADLVRQLLVLVCYLS